MGVNTNINISNIKEKLSEHNIKTARFALANQMLADMDNYVPFEEGSLSTSGHVRNDGTQLEWDTPYAKAQFYGFIDGSPVVNYTRSSHPYASKRWDEKAEGIHGKSWENVLLKGLKI